MSLKEFIEWKCNTSPAKVKSIFLFQLYHGLHDNWPFFIILQKRSFKFNIDDQILIQAAHEDSVKYSANIVRERNWDQKKMKISNAELLDSNVFALE